jgi:hypothetical protein
MNARDSISLCDARADGNSPVGYILYLKADDYMPVSEARQKAVNKYLRNTFDDIKTRVSKGK